MQAAQDDPDGEQHIFAQIMCATADFDVFMAMMKETKRRQDIKERMRK